MDNRYFTECGACESGELDTPDGPMTCIECHGKGYQITPAGSELLLFLERLMLLGV